MHAQKRTIDPMELIIEEALVAAGIRFTRDDRNAGRPALPDDNRLDFYLVDQHISIEVKQYHSHRVARQMATAENVIVAQGKKAVLALARMIRQQPLDDL